MVIFLIFFFTLNCKIEHTRVKNDTFLSVFWTKKWIGDFPLFGHFFVIFFTFKMTRYRLKKEKMSQKVTNFDVFRTKKWLRFTLKIEIFGDFLTKKVVIWELGFKNMISCTVIQRENHTHRRYKYLKKTKDTCVFYWKRPLWLKQKLSDIIQENRKIVFDVYNSYYMHHKNHY